MLQKILDKDHLNDLGTLKKEDGFSFDENTFSVFHRQFKWRHRNRCFWSNSNETNELERTNNEAITLAKTIFTEIKVEWAIESFEPFESPGRV